MNADLGKVSKQKLRAWCNDILSSNETNCNYDRLVFTNCRNIKPRVVQICTNPKSPDWQIGFFDTDCEVYFTKINIQSFACFSSIIRNYWWNGKEGEKKKKGYYSLIKLVKELTIANQQDIIDLADYMEGRYKTGKHWELYGVDRSIKLEIRNIYGLCIIQQATVERLSKYFDNIQCNRIRVNLKVENNITHRCYQYDFQNCKEVVPEKLVINTTTQEMYFHDVFSEVHIPKIVMEEDADLKSIIHNEYEKYRHEKHYSLLPYVQTLTIRNNPKLLCDLADYINGRYKIHNTFGSNWQIHQLNKNMKIVIEKPGIAFGAVKEIANYFVDVLIDGNKPEEYLVRQQPYQKSFQEHFGKYGLETDQIENFISASQKFDLKGEKFNVGSSSRKISRLHVNQKLTPQQFVCFHNTDEQVVINEIFIDDDGDIRCVLQNAYYNGTDSGFFSLLRTTKELEIYSDRNGDNQVLIDLADYIEGNYTLNTNWRQEELDKDMRINIDNGRYSLSLNVVQRLRNYFRNISIDRINTPLETENAIDQECIDGYVFICSRKTNPQKLVINAKLIGGWDLILFKDTDSEVRIPEIAINEQGDFAAIVQNKWENNKEGDEKKSRNYSLVKYVKTLTIRNNPEALINLADYVVGKYKIRDDCWKLQQLDKNIKVVVEDPGDAFLHVFRISKYFQFVTIDGKQPNDYIQIIEQEESKNPDYKAFRTCFEAHDLRIYPPQYSVEFQKELELVDCVYNIRKSMASINSLTVGQKLNINQFVCFHDINKPVTVDTIEIDDFGDLRSVLQNAYYKKGKVGFFSLLKTAKRLEIRENEQAVEDLADYVDGKYTLHPKWGRQALDKNMKIEINVMNQPSVAKRLRNYFKNVSIDCIWTLLETKNVIDQECEDEYIFSSCRNANPQKLVVNAKAEGILELILFDDADSEVCIPEITIGEHGSFDIIVHNKWQNCKNGDERKYGNYSLVSHVETLTIQNNPGAVRDLDNYISGNYKIKKNCWKVQKLNKNILVKINGVKDLDEQINRLKDYFSFIFFDSRKALGNCHQQILTHINSKSNDIRQRQAQNKHKQQSIDISVTSIQDAKQRVERARARLRRRRARFREYLALAE